MRKVVFHSYKGGVGRSMALSNVAVALARFGKKVVLLDLDIDAPGLHLKFVTPTFSEGYVDYLRECYASSPMVIGKRKQPEKQRRIEKLRSLALTPEDCGPLATENLRIIPAGNPAHARYWQLLSDDPWLFSVFTGPAWNGHTREVLVGELEILENVFDGCKADYLLIDCKSAGIYPRFVLSHWADVVVAMYPENNEGHVGIVQSFLMAKQEDGRPLRTIPVLCRIPEFIGDEPLQDIFKRFVETTSRAGLSDNTGVPLRTLHEYRELEYRESLLLAHPVRGTDAFADVVLSHDYADIVFDILEGEPETFTLEEVTRRLGLASDAQIMERYLQRLHDGRLLDDKQEQAVLRAATIIRIMESLADPNMMTMDQRANFEIERATRFLAAGHSVGRDFGDTWSSDNGQGGHLAEKAMEKRLQDWCAFDTGCGFGLLKSQDYNHQNKSGRIIWTSNFLLADKTASAATLPDYMKEFEKGYLAGVLEVLLGVPRDSVRVESNDENFAMFDFSVDDGIQGVELRTNDEQEKTSKAENMPDLHGRHDRNGEATPKKRRDGASHAKKR